MHVNHVTTNIKRGADVALGPKTLIIGGNGAGKSTVIHAVTLALGGFVGDLAGRDRETRAAEIRRLALVDGAKVQLKVEITRDDGVVQLLAAPADPAAPLAWFPAQELRTVLAGNNETRAKWLADQMANTATLAHYGAAWTDLPADLKETLKLPDGQKPLAWIAAEAVAAAAARKTANARLGDATAAAMAHGSAAGMPVDPAELAAAEAAATGSVDGITPQQQQQAQAEEARLTAEEARLTAEIQGAAANCDQIGAYLATVPLPAVSVDAQERAVLLAALKSYLEGPGAKVATTGACVACGAQHDPATLQAHIRTTLTAIPGLIAQLTAVPPDPAAQYRVSFQQWGAHRAQLERQQQQVVLSLQQIRQLLQRPLATGDADAAARLADLRARAAAHFRATEARTSRDAQEAEITRLDRRLEGLERLRTAVMKQALTTYIAAVNRYMPKGLKFAAEMGEVHTSVGVQVGDQPVSWAPSGAEEAALALAVGAAGAKDRPVILIPAERQWSPAMLAQVMRAVADAPCQVILVSTVMPEGKIARKTWTVLDLGEGPHGRGGGGGGGGGGAEDGSSEAESNGDPAASPAVSAGYGGAGTALPALSAPPLSEPPLPAPPLASLPPPGPIAWTIDDSPPDYGDVTVMIPPWIEEADGEAPEGAAVVYRFEHEGCVYGLAEDGSVYGVDAAGVPIRKAA